MDVVDDDDADAEADSDASSAIAFSINFVVMLSGSPVRPRTMSFRPCLRANALRQVLVRRLSQFWLDSPFCRGQNLKLG